MRDDIEGVSHAGRMGVAARLAPPPVVPALDGAPDGSLRGSAFPDLDDWPGAALPPRPSRAPGSATVEAARLSDGLVPLTRCATALGWYPGDDLAVHFDESTRQVVVRPGAYPLQARGQGTVGMWAGYLTTLDRRRRVRLPAPALMTLGVAAGGLLLAFGRRLPRVAHHADGDRTAVVLKAAQDFQPHLWMEQLTW